MRATVQLGIDMRRIDGVVEEAETYFLLGSNVRQIIVEDTPIDNWEEQSEELRDDENQITERARTEMEIVQEREHWCGACGQFGLNVEGAPRHGEEYVFGKIACSTEWRRLNESKTMRKIIEYEEFEEVELPEETTEGLIHEAAREIEDALGRHSQQTDKEIREMSWDEDLRTKITLCGENMLTRMAIFEEENSREFADKDMRRRVFKTLNPMEQWRCIRTTLGDMEEVLMANQSTMAKMCGTLNIILTEKPLEGEELTEETWREKLADQLSSYWMTLLEKPREQRDFKAFLMTKVLSWKAI